MNRRIIFLIPVLGIILLAFVSARAFPSKAIIQTVTTITTTFIAPTTNSMNFWIIGALPLMGMIMVIFMAVALTLDRGSIVFHTLLGIYCGVLVCYAASVLNFGFIVLVLASLGAYVWFGMNEQSRVGAF